MKTLARILQISENEPAPGFLVAAVAERACAPRPWGGGRLRVPTRPRVDLVPAPAGTSAVRWPPGERSPSWPCCCRRKCAVHRQRGDRCMGECSPRGQERIAPG